MQKIPTLFQRDPTTHLVFDSVTKGCEWVVGGEGKATRKLDGSCCMVLEGLLYKRLELKRGAQPLTGFVPCGQPDPHTGKLVGWLPVEDIPENKWHMEAWYALCPPGTLVNRGTYELLGPRINNNPEGTDRHVLIPHQFAAELRHCPRTFEDLRSYLSTRDIEGVVWHHRSGAMAKIKKRDFGLERAVLHPQEP